MTVRDDARDAGLLLRYALDHALSPARHDIYSQPLDRYHSDPDLRTVLTKLPPVWEFACSPRITRPGWC
jgi:hypothetical protein